MRNISNNGIMVNTGFLHPNGIEVYFGDQSGRIRIWDLRNNLIRELFDDPEDIAIRSLCISNNASKLIAGTSAGICYIWSS
jgi:WD40 repeat protein